jgi:hypothetical protein
MVVSKENLSVATKGFLKVVQMEMLSVEKTVVQKGKHSDEYWVVQMVEMKVD